MDTFTVLLTLCGPCTCHRWIPHTKSQQCQAMFSLTLTWTNCWTNNLVVGDWKRHDVHVTSPFSSVMILALDVQRDLERSAILNVAWWRHQNNGNIFRITGRLCGNSPVTHRSVPWSFDVFFDLRLTERLSKQWWGWGFETPSFPLCRHCNGHLINKRRLR